MVPRDLKVRVNNDRLIDIHRELTKLKRKNYPNAGAVMLRVFFELAVLDYLERNGELKALIKKLEKKENRPLPFGVPTLKQLVPEIVRIAKKKLEGTSMLTESKRQFAMILQLHLRSVNSTALYTRQTFPVNATFGNSGFARNPFFE